MPIREARTAQRLITKSCLFGLREIASWIVRYEN
jgi:hypothetical protein